MDITSDDSSFFAVDKLSVTYSNSIRALSELSLDVPRGSVVALLGSNGAGKSTLMRAASGLLGFHNGKVDHGSITFLGERIENESAAEIVQRGLVHVPEGRRVFSDLSVEENLRVGATSVKSKSTRDSTLEHVHELFPVLADRRKQRAGLLSGGEQQMLAIGRGLMSSPKLLLLDEPSLGLAPKIVDLIGEVIQKISESGTTVLLVEQNASMALAHADIGYVIDLGTVSLSGTSKELSEGTEVQELYLGTGGGAEQELRPWDPEKSIARWGD